MITVNEEENLPRCLDSVEGVVDEIIVVDTGSTDQTPAIARERGARLKSITWPEDFSAARNQSLDLATGDWILVLDADEALDPDDGESLRELIEEAHGRGGVEGFLLRIVNHLGPDERTPLESHAALRLFRNRPAHRYRGAVHEQPQVPKPAISDIRVHHYGYLPEAYARRGKAERNERLLRKGLQADPDDSFLLYSLGVLYYVTKRYDEARETLTRAISLTPAGRHYHARALKVLAMAEGRGAGPAAAVASLDQAIDIYPDFTDLRFLRAGYRREAGDKRGALCDACACLCRGEAPLHYDSHSGVGGTLALSLLEELLSETRAERARVYDALRRAAQRGLQPDRCFALGLAEIRRSGPPKGRVAGAAGRLLTSYLRYLWASALRLLEKGARALPWCETLGHTWRAFGATAEETDSNDLPGLPPPAHPDGGGPAGAGARPGRLGSWDRRDGPNGPESPVRTKTESDGEPHTTQRAEPAPRRDAAGSVPDTPAEPTISACLVVKDEAATLSRCLASVCEDVDEIIVVDTGSTDKSPEIAASFGARVFRREWTGDFSAARNFGLEQAGSEWILQLDADEEMAPGHAPLLRNLIRSHPEAEGFLLRMVDFLGDYPGLDRAANMSFRLFRNRAEHRYSRAFHEQMVPCVLERDGRPTVVSTTVVIYHYGYLNPVDRAKRRSERNSRLAEREQAEKDDPFGHFNLAAEHLKAGRYREALIHYREAIEKADERLTYAAEARVRAAVTLALLGAPNDALAELDEARRLYPNFTDIHFVRGEVLRSLGRKVEAREAFTRCLELGETPLDYPTLLGVGTYRAATCLGEVCEDLGSPRTALTCYARALGSEPKFTPAYLGRARALLSLHGEEAVARFASELAPAGDPGPRLNLLMGYAWLSRGKAEWAVPFLVRARGEADEFGETQVGPALAKIDSLLGLALFFLGRDHEAAIKLSGVTGNGGATSAHVLALLSGGCLDEARAAARRVTSDTKRSILLVVVADYEADPTGELAGGAEPAEPDTAGPPTRSPPERRADLEEIYREAPQTYVEIALEVISLAARREHPGLLAATLELMRPVEGLGPWLRLGYIYRELGLETMAAVELADCLRHGVVDPVAAAIVGDYLRVRGHEGEAEDYFRKALDWDGQCWRAWMGLWNLRRRATALAAREAISLLPHDEDLRRTAGELLRAAGEPDPLPADA